MVGVGEAGEELALEGVEASVGGGPTKQALQRYAAALAHGRPIVAEVVSSMSLDALAACLTSGATLAPKERAAVRAAFSADPVGALAIFCPYGTGGGDPWCPVGGRGCPWRPAASAAEAVLAAFDPLTASMKSLVAALSKRALAVLARKEAGQWQLLYLVEVGGAKGESWRLQPLVAGPPATAPELSPAARKAGWALDADLAAFYAVHDGFGIWGDGAWGVDAVLPAGQLEVLPAVIGHANNAAKTPIIAKDGLLAFFIDSVGNRRGLYRQVSGGLVYKKAVEWDRFTKEVGMLQGPLKVIQAQLVAQLAGR